MNDRFMNTYKRTGLVLDHGKGATLYTTDGAEYIDFTAGIGVNSLGHAHPRLFAAISEQAAKLIHVSNYFLTDISSQVAEELTSMAGMDKVFFCNSGAEANEGLIKIARKYGSAKNPTRTSSSRSKVPSTQDDHHSHGDGSGQVPPILRSLPPGFIYAEANNIAALDAALGDKVCAFISNPPGRGGVNPSTRPISSPPQSCAKRGFSSSCR